MKNLLNRIKNVLCLGPNYYHGDLYNFFDNTFSNLEKNIVSASEAKKKLVICFIQTNLFKIIF